MCENDFAINIVGPNYNDFVICRLDAGRQRGREEDEDEDSVSELRDWNISVHTLYNVHTLFVAAYEININSYSITQDMI